jgi:hypothetical protein
LIRHQFLPDGSPFQWRSIFQSGRSQTDEAPAESLYAADIETSDLSHLLQAQAMGEQQHGSRLRDNLLRDSHTNGHEFKLLPVSIYKDIKGRGFAGHLTWGDVFTDTKWPA